MLLVVGPGVREDEWRRAPRGRRRLRGRRRGRGCSGCSGAALAARNTSREMAILNGRP